MPGQQPAGPRCQSCGMPMTVAEDFGTDQPGGRVTDFCRYCFANGAFTAPDISMSAMIDKGVAVMAAQGIMPAPQARALMTELLPRLKRWRTPAGNKP